MKMVIYILNTIDRTEKYATYSTSLVCLQIEHLQHSSYETVRLVIDMINSFTEIMIKINFYIVKINLYVWDEKLNINRNKI